MYKSLQEVRDAYDENYKQICETISRMGGEQFIDLHRRNRSQLYLKLRRLQKQEHYLDTLENILLNGQRPTYFESARHISA